MLYVLVNEHYTIHSTCSNHKIYVTHVIHILISIVYGNDVCSFHLTKY